MNGAPKRDSVDAKHAMGTTPTVYPRSTLPTAKVAAMVTAPRATTTNRNTVTCTPVTRPTNDSMTGSPGAW
jgi:hypothetical protein